MWPLLMAVLENARKGKVVWNGGSDILCNVVTVRCEGAYRSRSQNTASDCDTGRSGPLTNLILGIFKDEKLLPGMKHEMQWNVEWGFKWSYAWGKILPLSSPPPPLFFLILGNWVALEAFPCTDDTRGGPVCTFHTLEISRLLKILKSTPNRPLPW